MAGQILGIMNLHMADISIDDVLRLASLSKLKLNDNQLHRFRDELAAIVAYVDQLSEADVTGLEPTNQVTGLVNVMRPDVEKTFTTPAELLKNAPSTEGNLIKVRRVLE